MFRCFVQGFTGQFLCVSHRDVPDIRFRLAGYPAIFSNPVPAPVPAKMVPGTGYLSRIVHCPFWQFALPEESLLNIEHDCSLIMQKG